MSRPIVLAAPSGLHPGAVLTALIGLRMGAGVAENAGLAHASEAAALVLLAALAFLQLVQMRLARPTALLLAGLGAWIGAAVLGALTAPLARPQDSVELIALLALYALAANGLWLHLRGADGLRRLEGLFTGYLVLGVVTALAQIATGGGFVDPGKPETMRAFGPDVHPVSFGLQMVIAATGLAVVRLRRGAGWRGWHGALAAGAALALYLSYARTAWALALVVLALAWAARGPAPRAALRLLGAGLAGAGLVALSGRFDDLASLPLFWQQFDPAQGVFDFRFIDNSVSWRIVNWTQGLAQALERPWLGHGAGQSAAASAFHLEMHNIVLELFFELGLVGLAAFGLVIGGLVRLHRGAARVRPHDRAARRLATALGLGLAAAALLSTSMVDQTMTVLLYLMVLRAADLPRGDACQWHRPVIV